MLLRFVLQFHNILIYVLLGAAFVTGLLHQLVDTAVILSVVLLEAADKVPADLRLLGIHGLQIQEAILTGESIASRSHRLRSRSG